LDGAATLTLTDVKLVDRLDLPPGYCARPYRGRADHPAMASVLGEYRAHSGVAELPTVEQMDVTYANFDHCDPDRDVAIIECEQPDGNDDVAGDDENGAVVGYLRPRWDDVAAGTRDCVLFSPLRVAHMGRLLFNAVVEGQERHMLPWATEQPPARWRGSASHPGPGQPATGEASWLEERGYVSTEWGASLVRPHLDDIPERSLPDGVEVRPVTKDQLRTILAADFEAFRGEWDFHEPTEEDYADVLESPHLDESLWKVAWAGDVVVGQVKTFVNTDENAARGYRRGYTEYIATHRDWRNRGIAGALLAMSLCELRDRGMSEAALSVDTNNPGGAFQLYTSLGFEPRSYQAVYTKPVPRTSKPTTTQPSTTQPSTTQEG